MPVDDLNALLIERACTKLMTDYTRFVDFGEAERIAELFTSDGVWEGPGVVMDGQENIRASFARRAGVTRRASRHVITNIAIDVVDEDLALGLSYLVNFRHDNDGAALVPAPAGLPKFVGEYHDRFVRTAAGWRFEHRRFDVAFLRSPSPSGNERS